MQLLQYQFYVQQWLQTLYMIDIDFLDFLDFLKVEDRT